MGQVKAPAGMWWRCPIAGCDYCHWDLLCITSKVRHWTKGHPTVKFNYNWIKKNATFIPEAEGEAYRKANRGLYRWGKLAKPGDLNHFGNGGRGGGFEESEGREAEGGNAEERAEFKKVVVAGKRALVHVSFLDEMLLDPALFEGAERKTKKKRKRKR